MPSGSCRRSLETSTVSYSSAHRVCSTITISTRRFSARPAAVVFGEAEEVFAQEKQEALEGLLSKYSPDHFEKGLKYIEALSPETKVFRISIAAISGKARR